MPITPLSITRFSPNLITDLSPGKIFISPNDVAIDMELSPSVRLSDASCVGTPQVPDPSPSDIHDCPVLPAELIPNSTFSEDKIPSSVRSVRLESNF